MIVEPTEDGTFVVIGRSEVVTAGTKRDHDGEEQEGKKARLDHGVEDDGPAEQSASEKVGEPEATETKATISKPAEDKQKAARKGSGDLFLAHGLRARLAKELDVSIVTAHLVLTVIQS